MTLTYIEFIGEKEKIKRWRAKFSAEIKDYLQRINTRFSTHVLIRFCSPNIRFEIEAHSNNLCAYIEYIRVDVIDLKSIL